jgi:zinc protease
MLFKPVARDGSLVDMATAVEALGGDVNAFTSHDETVYHASLPAVHWLAGMRAIVEPVLRPSFENGALASEIGVVLEEIKQYDDDPGARATQDLLAALFGRHDYARPVLGLAHEVRRHDAARLRGFHRRAYAARRLVLVVAGPVDPARALAVGERLLAGAPRRAGRLVERPPRVPSSPRLHVLRGDASEAHLLFGWQAPALPHADACAIEMAAVVLGWGEAAWLSEQTRRRDQLVTSAHASFFSARQCGSLVVAANTPAARAADATEAVLGLVGRLARVPIGDEDFARARAVLTSELVYRRETVHGQAQTLGAYLSLQGRLDVDREYFAVLDQLEPADVRRACAKWVTARAAAVTILLPRKATVPKLVPRIRRALAGLRTRSGRAWTVRTDRDGFQCVDLPSGVRIRAKVDRSLPMVAGWLAWPGGQRLEAARDAGATALASALLTRGTTVRDGDMLAREIEGCAAALEGLAGRNSVAIHFEGLATHAELLVRRALECALMPSFPEDELDEERRVALEEIAAERDELAAVAVQTALASLYGAHPFGRRRRGDPSSLRALDSRRLRALWRRDYPLGRAVLGVCGDVDVTDVAALIDAASAHSDVPGAPRWPGPPPRRHGRPIVRRIRRPREQAHLVLAHPGLRLRDARLPVLEVLTTILGGQTGRLFVSLREERGLVYSVSASSVEGADAGHVVVHAATGQPRLARARAAVEAELSRIVAASPSVEELERAQAWLVGQAEAGLQRRGRVASALAIDELYGLGYAAHVHYRAQIERVRAKDVLALARELFDPRSRVTAIVSA